MMIKLQPWLEQLTMLVPHVCCTSASLYVYRYIRWIIAMPAVLVLSGVLALKFLGIVGVGLDLPVGILQRSFEALFPCPENRFEVNHEGIQGGRFQPVQESNTATQHEHKTNSGEIFVYSSACTY